MPTDVPRRLALAAAAALTLGAAAPAAHAVDEDGARPWRLGAQQGFQAETNLFRQRSDEPCCARDIISSTALLAGLDLLAGRQRLSLDADVSANRFVKQKQLDNTGHALTLSWRGQSAGRVSGSGEVSQRSQLFRYDSDTQRIATERTTATDRNLWLNGEVGTVTDWTLEGGVQARDLDHSGDTFEYRDLRQAGFNVAARFQPSPDWSSRVGLRQARGSYPHAARASDGAWIANDFRRQDLELRTRLSTAGQSDWVLRLARTRIDYDRPGVDDRDEWTGEAQWIWTPTGKTRWTFRLRRDSEASAYALDGSGLSESGSDDKLGTLAGVQWRWQPGAKLQVDVDASVTRRSLTQVLTLTPDLPGSDPLVLTGQGRDRLARLSLRTTWEFQRGWTSTCSIGQERRSTTAIVSGSYPFKASVANCSLRVMTR
jgi:hypothetical protein